MGPLEQIKTWEQMPLIDVGAVKLIKSGALPVYPGIARFTPGGVVFTDGRERHFDAVVLITGYRSNISSLPSSLTLVRQWRIVYYAVHRDICLHETSNRFLSDEEYMQLQAALIIQPDLGDLIPGSGGLRKLRWGIAGKGK